MESKEVSFRDEDHIQLVMQPDAMALNEVVMIAEDRSVALPQEISPISTSAQPSIGYKSFKDYVEQNISFPELETEIDRAVVVLKFTVSASGKLTQFVALRSPGQSFTEEAKRLIQEGPAWLPASNEEGMVDEEVRLRIVFKK
jgi:hypothetical protein